MAGKKTAGLTRKLLAVGLLFGPALILILISSRACEHKFKELDDYGAAVNYTFVDANGKEYSYKDFKDKVVLVNVLQPECPENCSVSFWHLDQLIYQNIRKNKKKLGSVRIISFVTDGNGNPVEDLSSLDEMLRDQIEEYDPEVWMLASGDAEALYDFENNNTSILQEGEEYYGGHAFQELLLLLDRDNHLRMVMSGKTEGMVRRMKEHLALLQKQYAKAAVKNEKSN